MKAGDFTDRGQSEANTRITVCVRVCVEYMTESSHHLCLFLFYLFALSVRCQLTPGILHLYAPCEIQNYGWYILFFPR